MFVFHRNALAVLIPLALLATVVALSNRSDAPPVEKSQVHTEGDHANQVAVNLPSR
jgi:hypothetical protein